MQWRKGIYWTYSDRLETYCLSRHKKKKKKKHEHPVLGNGSRDGNEEY